MRLKLGYLRHLYAGFETSRAFSVVHGGRFEHRLLPAERTTMAHARLTVGEVSVENGCYDMPMIAQGILPSDAICTGFMAQGAHATRIATELVGQDEMQRYPPGENLLYHATAASHWANFTVPEEHLQMTAVERTARPVALARHLTSRVRLRPGGCDRLSGELGDALSRGRSNTSISLSEIAQPSDYSLRALELIFSQSVGTTPGRWFITMRLNGALRDLLMPEQVLTVSDIASKWGFRHKSRFADQFRRRLASCPALR